MTCSSTPEILSGVIIDAAIIAYIVFLSGTNTNTSTLTIIVTAQIFNALITYFLIFFLNLEDSQLTLCLVEAK
jgi:hypothetical protein